ncbi:MAG: phosphatidate cytidylyltransferase [Bacteroidota bacterium]|nr:phosphatidate cytidylyltransferase [Bacteroidota bacterium]
MNNLIKRSLTGLIFVVVVVGAIALSKYSFFILFLGLIVLGMNEFFNLIVNNDNKFQKILGIILASIVFISNYIYAQEIVDSRIFLIIIVLVIMVFIVELYLQKELPFSNIANTIIAVLYIAVPFSLINYMVFRNSNIEYNSHLILGFLFLTWSYDSFAYLFGVSFGKHRLFERISPKKSWEGFIGGIILSIFTAYIVSLFFQDLQFVQWVIVSLIASIGGTFGDLTESMLKRSVNIKDSGNILPGHGGILDRFDAVLVSLPLFYVYLQLLN